MKKIIFFLLAALILSACQPSSESMTPQPQVTITLTETPIPAPTLHPQFVELQQTIAAAGERYTLDASTGYIYDGADVVPGLRIAPDGTMTLEVGGEVVKLDPSKVSFDDKGGVIIDGYELNEEEQWVEAESPAVQTMQAAFGKYNALLDKFTVTAEGESVVVTDPETGMVVYKDGSFEPLFLGQLIVENGMCMKTEWIGSRIGHVNPSSDLQRFTDLYGQPLSDTYLLFVKNRMINNTGLKIKNYYLGEGCWGRAYYNKEDQPKAWYFWRDPNGKPLYEQVFMTPKK